MSVTDLTEHIGSLVDWSLIWEAATLNATQEIATLTMDFKASYKTDCSRFFHTAQTT
jgi:hypothetical protein